MELTLSTLGDICGIAGFIISIVAIGGVIRINKRITKIDNSNTQTAKGSRNTQTITK